jgi:hypothetical protein
MGEGCTEPISPIGFKEGKTNREILKNVLSPIHIKDLFSHTIFGQMKMAKFRI